jgi:hypothetical protein
MKKRFLPTVLLSTLSLVASPPLLASVSDKEFSELKAELLLLMERVNILETENTDLKTTSQASIKTIDMAEERISKMENQSKKSSWATNSKWKGDFRYRYEDIRVEDQDNRNRNRIRSRIALISQLPQDVEVGFGMATGGDDPVSTNQTLGGGGSTKDVRLDLAYFNWTATKKINVIAGKFKNVWHRPDKNELMWDSDWNPEGFAITYKSDMLFVNGGLNWLESDSKKENSEFAWGLQSGIKTNFGDNFLIAGVGYYDLPVKGREAYFGDDDDFFGNSFSCTDPSSLEGCTYDNDYKEAQIFAEFRTHLGELPVVIFGDYVQNTDVDEFDTAWATGLKIGKASNTGLWELAYRYQDLEADSLFGLTVNSDFAGGGTDAKGHIFKGAYALNKKWQIGFTYFDNKRNGNQGTDEDYDRLQIDTKFKF